MIENCEFLGLPVPDSEEYLALWNVFFNDSYLSDVGSADVLLDIIGGIVPNLERVEKHDVRFWNRVECPVGYSPLETEEFTFGISAGYDFTVSSFTMLSMIRSEAKTLEEYMDMAPNRLGGLPVLSSQEFHRVTKVREGDALIDAYNDNRSIEDSRGLAAYDARDYNFVAHYMDKIVEEQVNRFFKYSAQDDELREIQAYVDGFRHGYTNAVQMYVQSYEEQLLRSLEVDLSDELNDDGNV